jgi:hypothetical protein
MLRVSLVFVFSMAKLSIATSALASSCDSYGLTEKTILPAELEYGEITRTIYNSWGPSAEQVSPAVTKTMSISEYKALQPTLTYGQARYVAADIQRTQIDLPELDIAEYDLVHHANGAVTERPLVKSPRQELYNEELIKPAELKYDTVEIARPAPQILPSGDVIVVMQPATVAPVLAPGRMVTVTQRFLKKRTPAIIHKVPCVEKERAK